MNNLGIDIGGTKIYVARYNAALEVEAEIKVPTLAEEPKESTLENLVAAILEVKNEETQGIGIAWAGFVDVAKGQIIKAPNVPALDGFCLCDYITEKTGLKAIIENDARAFAYGTKTQKAPDAKLCLGLIIGTGVGSGIIYENKVFYGAHGFAGEVGHMVMQQKEVEAWLAGPGLKNQLGLEKEAKFSTILPQQKQALIPQIENALGVFSQWLGALILSFNPDHIIIGGGTAVYFWQHFEAEIKARTNAQIQNYPHDFKLQFYEGRNAGAAGAAALSRL